MGVKKLLFVALGLVAVSAFAVTAESDSDKRKRIARTLYGRIKIVDSAEDYRVRIVDSAEDLRVQLVTHRVALSPGEWQIVTSAQDFRVRFVNSAEDLKIRIVDAIPGPSN